jgi:hypothetical protein
MLIINFVIVGQIFVLFFFFVFNVSTEILSFHLFYIYQPVIYWYPVLLNIPTMFMLFEPRDFKLIYFKIKLLFSKIFKKK